MGFNEIYEHPNFSEWLILIVVLILGTYAAFKIKNEKSYYLQTAKVIDLNYFSLLVPSWWSVTENSTDYLKFERTDTRYDWFSSFTVETKSEKSTEERLSQIIEDYKVKFDEGFEVENLKLVNEKKGFKISRREGMATKNGVERTYVDFAVVDFKNKRLIAESHSSILNGCVEGPYFEEVLRRIDLASTSRESSDS